MAAATRKAYFDKLPVAIHKVQQSALHQCAEEIASFIVYLESRPRGRGDHRSGRCRRFRLFRRQILDQGAAPASRGRAGDTEEAAGSGCGLIGAGSGRPTCRSTAGATKLHRHGQVAGGELATPAEVIDSEPWSRW